MLAKTLLPVLLAAAAAPAIAQQDQPGADGRQGELVIEAGTIDLQELIDRSAGFLGWNILANEQELQNTAMGGQKLKLQNRVAVDRDGCEDLLTTMLDSKGFVLCTLDETKRLYEVISRNGPRMRDIAESAVQKTPEKVLARPNLRVPVVTVMQLRHINATIANNALRPFFASVGSPHGTGITIGNVGNSTSLLVSGMQDQVAAAIRLVAECDVPPAHEAKPGLAERLDALESRIAALEKAIAELKKGE